MSQIAGYVAEYLGLGGPNCYGFGETEAIARMRVNHLLSDMIAAKRAFIMGTITYRPVGPDEASEICEMLETPW
jgi:hypothetical protein